MINKKSINASVGKTLPSWVEVIKVKDEPLAYIIRGGQLPERTEFLTPPEFKQQVGYIVYPSGGEIARHLHHPQKRNLVGTSEILLVLKGRAEADIYDNTRVLIATRELCEGDIILMIEGGHSFSMLEDTVFLEIKQGPYSGLDEKAQF